MLSIYAVAVWCVDRIGIEPSVGFQAPWPTTLAQIPIELTGQIDQLAVPLAAWCNGTKQQCQIIGYFQYIGRRLGRYGVLS